MSGTAIMQPKQHSGSLWPQSSRLKAFGPWPPSAAYGTLSKCKTLGGHPPPQLAALCTLPGPYRPANKLVLPEHRDWCQAPGHAGLCRQVAVQLLPSSPPGLCLIHTSPTLRSHSQICCPLGLLSPFPGPVPACPPLPTRQPGDAFGSGLANHPQNISPL